MNINALVLFFNQIDKDDVQLVGGKGANLGEMTKANFPVPNGFALTVKAYELFLEESDIEDKIYSILKNTNVDNPEELDRSARNIQNIITKTKVHQEVVNQVYKGYKKLSHFLRPALVAVRSSATAEDMPKSSFAGQQTSFLNIKGEANLINAIRDCWASLFTARSIFYRVQNKIPHEKVKISVIVQKMIASEVSGVMFTVDPVTNEKDKIVIEAVWGLGEMIVQGSVIPDRYLVQKETNDILSKEISQQAIQLVKVGNTNKEIAVPDKIMDLQKISDKDITKLAKLGELLQKHYYFPQDVEWAKEGKNIFIVQTRPITTLKSNLSAIDSSSLKMPTSPVLVGSGASPGIATGFVKIVKNPKEIFKVKKGDILVSIMTSPDFVPAMKRASGIVTDEGGETSHAAIVSRELGIPCVVGTKEATKKLKDGIVVTVDGTSGLIYMGSSIVKKTLKKVIEQEITQKSATRLYVNLAEPQRAREIAQKNVDGVGLLRAEFMIANIGLHPKEAIKLKKQKDFVNKLAADLTIFCKNFSPRPVVYRATDFKTSEYRQLKGGEAWEPKEPNPMLGFRGAFRYVSNPDVFSLELEAIKKVREKYNNLWLMVPFVRSPLELSRVRRIVASEGLFASTSFKFWMMVELPVNVIIFEEFVKVGIDGVSIGSNDLTMLILGTDRDNAEVAQAFNERSEAVLWSIKRVLRLCQKHNITSSICGQAPSEYDDLVQLLVKQGVSSVSVNPDAINRVRRVIINTEKEINK